ncbi:MULTISPECIES: DUF1501 domain-containing protein [unclassified Schlesneria]|uniref:DUF1501 domain-containing protein n=1 Tax=unclassified Schlesneria TaxID=2762017 RepID=UPI002F07B846
MQNHQHRAGVTRRELIQAGYSGLLGVGLTSVLGRRAQAAPASQTEAGRSPKSIIIVFLTGACSHHDTFDMKPDAPAEIRGEFRPIATTVPGYSICEHLPLLAARAGKYAVIRTLSHEDNNHLMSTHHVLTGQKQPGGFFDKVASRDDWPCYSSALSFLRRRDDGLPSGVNLPTFLREGPLTWPGQHAGFLGQSYDPWQITGDPNKPDFRVDALTLVQGMDVNHLGQRKLLLEELNRKQEQFAEVAQSLRLQKDQQLALNLLTSSRLGQAFELHRESDGVRDAYGRTTQGQSLLAARRLVEAGVPIVQVNMGRVQNWDHHGGIFPTLKQRMLPALDQCVSALLDDLESRGMLQETLVMMLGEFGRTPKINKDAGRDHWGPCFFGLFAGAGVQGGQVIGRSDVTGSYPATRGFSPDDVGATVYHLLGLPAEVEVEDRLGRRVLLNRGDVIESLFNGTSV